jgi:hypothetical protein
MKRWLAIMLLSCVVTLGCLEVTEHYFLVKTTDSTQCVKVWSAFKDPYDFRDGCVVFRGVTPAGTPTEFPGPIFCGTVTLEAVPECKIPLEATK